MADYTPVYQPGSAWSATTSAAVTGGTLLAVSGNGTVATAGAASSAVVGVAAFDAASGARVTVHAVDGVVHELIASSAVTAGDVLASAAGGQVAPIGAGTFGQKIGVALTTAAGGAKVRVLGAR